MNKPSLTLQLIHGRNAPNATMNGWGFDAEPITGISYLHGTYLQTLTVGFVSEEAYSRALHYTGWKPWDELVLEIPLAGDLIKCGGAYYGDFEVYQRHSHFDGLHASEYS